jgi:nitrogen fixation NifU-like protein
MTALETLYDELVVDHIRNARNYRVIEKADRVARQFNPLCGDELILYLELEDDNIADIAFQCSCCGISMASASMMTEAVKGTSEARARSLAEQFLADLMRTSRAEAPIQLISMPVLSAVHDFPSRLDCAALAWLALLAAFEAV